MREECHLSFAPTVNVWPKVLSLQQIEHYNREGHIKPIVISNAAEADADRKYFDALWGKMRTINDRRRQLF